MNEEIDTLLKNVTDEIEEFDKDKSYTNAVPLQFNLTCMKLMIGIDRFNELPAFERYLRETTRIIEKENQND